VAAGLRLFRHARDRQNKSAIHQQKDSNKPNKNMKTTDQIELTPRVAARGNLTVGTANASLAPQREQAPDKNALRPFRVNVPEAELNELRRRINATKWPERETVSDATQGVQLATIQALASYWATEYDWRKTEAKPNARPQS